MRRPPPPAPPARGAGTAAVRVTTLRLGLRTPYHWASMLAFLAARAIPGVERVEGGAYARAFALDGVAGTVAVRLAAAEGALVAEVRTAGAAPVAALAERVGRLFDLAADPGAIDARLGRDPLLAPRVRARPGMRVPGAWEPFELAVRAILGQQISVAAARTLAGRIAARHGEPVGVGAGAELRLAFPGPERLARARLGGLGLTGARARALVALARATARDPAVLAPGPSLDRTVARLCELPGIGRWTAQYIAMRAFHEADAFPEGDLGLAKALARRGARRTAAALLRRAERWRPWRAYAALHLWAGEPPRGE